MPSSRSIQTQFLLFIAVGVLNTAFSYSLFAGLIWLGLNYKTATLIAAALGVLFNFRTIGPIVFKCHDNRRIFLFVLMYALAYFLSIAVQRLCHDLGINAYWAGIVALPPTVIFTFLFGKLVVFRKPSA